MPAAEEDRSREEKLAIAAAGLLVLTWRRAARRMAAIARGHAADAKHRSDRSSGAGKIAALHAVSRNLAPGLADAILLARREAREAAVRRLGVELRALGAKPQPHVLHALPVEEDALSADAVAGSIASRWLSRAHQGALEARRKGEEPRGRLGEAYRVMAPELERAAVTEAARAYNDEHRAALDRARAADPELGLRLAVLGAVDRWSCFLEGRVCQRCLEHEGEEVSIGEPFAHGDEPGFMHPRCSCLRVLARGSK